MKRRDFLKGIMTTIGGIAVIKTVPKPEPEEEKQVEEPQQPREWHHLGFTGTSSMPLGGSSCAFWMGTHK